MEIQMFTHFWFRILLGLPGFLIWFVLYLAVRFRGIDLQNWSSLVSAGFIVLMAVGLGFDASDYAHVASVLQLNAWGFFGAAMWLRQHYRDRTPVVQGLNITETKPRQD
jgi:hypothetical protein